MAAVKTLRYSGTEPLVRVMIEGRDVALVERLVLELTTFFEARIGREAQVV